MRISGIKFRETLLSQMRTIWMEESRKKNITIKQNPFILNTQILMKIHCFTSALWIKFQTLVCFILMSLAYSRNKRIEIP